MCGPICDPRIGLWTKIVVPVPVTDVTLINSSSILTISFAEIVTIPLVAKLVSKIISLDNVAAIPVLEIGAWAMLSIVTNALVFCFVAVMKCELPTPTFVNSIKVGLIAWASVAFVANPIWASFILTTNKSVGKSVVDPTLPPKLVVTIPILWSTPVTVYLTASPLW